MSHHGQFHLPVDARPRRLNGTLGAIFGGARALSHFW